MYSPVIFIGIWGQIGGFEILAFMDTHSSKFASFCYQDDVCKILNALLNNLNIGPYWFAVFPPQS